MIIGMVIENMVMVDTKFIPGRWEKVAKKLVDIYISLKYTSKILDVGCGKGFFVI